MVMNELRCWLVVLGLVAVTFKSPIKLPMAGETFNQLAAVVAFQEIKLELMLKVPNDAESAPITSESGVKLKSSGAPN
jgi:hypothetical protein